MWIYNFNFENDKFDFDFVDKNSSIQIGKLYIDSEIYMFFPVNRVDDQYIKIIYPVKYYTKDLNEIFKDVVVKYLIFLVVILLFSFLFSLYSLKPLKDALNLLNEFLRDIIHDLNTPISSMLLNIKMLRKKYEDSNELNRLELGVRSIGNLYKNLEYFIKDIKLQKDEVLLDELIKQRVEFFRYIYPRIDFKLNLYPKICICDKDSITRILDNLFSNACKYNKKPYIVSIELKDNKLIIKDSGIGIKKPHLVFERYYKESERGLGIGLNIVKKLCDKLGIEIFLSSKINEGSEFRLQFSYKSLKDVS
jgi:two-component system OmpR family sensor kinase